MNGPKIFVEKFPNQVKYKVFLVDFKNQEKNSELLKGAKIVKFPNEAEFKIFLVPTINQADICILKSEFSKF